MLSYQDIPVAEHSLHSSYFFICIITRAGIGNECIKELKNFEMDTENRSAFEVANSLWDMIEQNQMQEA